MVQLDFDALKQTELPFIPPIPCTGLTYRARVNNYYHNGSVVYQTKMAKLKRQSCPGCEQCGYLEDNLFEFISNKSNILFPEEVVDGKLYTLQVTNISHDRESGFADDWDLEFVEKKDG